VLLIRTSTAAVQYGFLCNAAAMQQGVTRTVNAWQQHDLEKLLKQLQSQTSITL